MAPVPALAQASQLSCELLHIHERLLCDAARNGPFYEALRATITPDSVVLDIGAGTGLWAIMAAKLGARKVVAIEMQPLLIGLIKALARDHGVADRVEVIQGDARQVSLAREFDVVVSETIGHVVFDEQIVEIMIDARERFLKPGGALIPESVTLQVAGAHLHETALLPAGIVGMVGTFDRFSSLRRHAPLALADKTNLELLTAPATLVHVDLHRVTAEPALENLTAHWPQQDTARINCFAVWAEATLARGIRVSTLDTPSWSATAYRVQPFAATRGDLAFRLALTASTNHWTATLDEEAQAFSPEIAATELLVLNAPDPEVFEKMKRQGLAHLTPFGPPRE